MLSEDGALTRRPQTAAAWRKRAGLRSGAMCWRLRTRPQVGKTLTATRCHLPTEESKSDRQTPRECASPGPMLV